jgi:hypothetical protein
MTERRSGKFAHRYTNSGRIESICLTCFVTLCRCFTTEEMICREAEHVCDPEALLVSAQLEQA